MKKHAFLILVSALCLSLISILPCDAAHAEKLVRGNDPVVVELFSSQGCGYCPQADKYLAELSQNAKIVTLACHVDYFDTLYWKDPLSLPICAERQSGYIAKIAPGPKYTPQMIINGDIEAVGYRYQDVDNAIRLADNRRMVSIDTSWTEDGKINIRLPTSNLGTRDTVVWLVQLQEPRYLTVQGGTNRGKKIYYVDIISRMTRAGTWAGKEKQITITPTPDKLTGSYAVLLQTGNGLGRIIGASVIELPDKDKS